MNIIDKIGVFKSFKRNESIRNIVLHETGGRSAQNSLISIAKRGLGVHYIIDKNGDVYFCVDPELGTSHALGMNNRSIGIEIVNPYTPGSCGNHISEYNLIPAQWWTWTPNINDRRYVLPFKIQLVNCFHLLEYLTKKYNIDFVFPTITYRHKLKAEEVKEGIVAHRDFGNHADGRYILERMYDYQKMTQDGVII